MSCHHLPQIIDKPLEDDVIINCYADCHNHFAQDVKGDIALKTIKPYMFDD